MSSHITLAPFANEVMEALERLHDFGEIGLASALRNAPMLTNWHPLPTTTQTLCLLGTVQGHPRLTDGRTIRTSPLVATTADGSWALTLNTLYQLGRAKHSGGVQ